MLNEPAADQTPERQPPDRAEQAEPTALGPLRARLAQALEQARAALRARPLPTGFPALDRALPDQGLKHGWLISVVDDGGFDSTVLLARQLADQGAKVTIYDRGFSLSAAALGDMIEEARDELDVAFVDERSFADLDGELAALQLLARERELALIVTHQAAQPGIPTLGQIPGSARGVDYCDLIFSVWRPELEDGLDEQEQEARSGRCEVALLKNRYGPSGLETSERLVYDGAQNRLKPAAPADDSLATSPDDSPLAYWRLGEAS